MQISLINFIENEEKVVIYYFDEHGNLTQRIVNIIRINEENISSPFVMTEGASRRLK